MEGVRQGVHWLPKMSEVKYFDVVSCPPKQMLAEIVVAAIGKHHVLDQHPPFKATCDRLLKVPPSKSFLLCILGTLEPSHAVFEKGYIKPLKKLHTKEVVNIQNDGFFDDLPLSNKRGGRLRIGVPVVQTKTKQERKIEEL